MNLDFVEKIAKCLILSNIWLFWIVFYSILILISFVIKTILFKVIEWFKKYDIKKEVEEIYRVKKKNILIVSFFCLFIFFVTVILIPLLATLFNVHLCLNLKIDYLTIYCGFLSIILPVAILIAEKIRDEHNKLLSEAYLHNTYIFPIIIYFVDNLLLFSFTDSQYFFIITFIISGILIIFMYFKSFIIVSDRFCEQSVINTVKKEMIEKDLIDQISHFDNNNLINNYKKYGIFVRPFDNIPVDEYEKLPPLYPAFDYQIIKNYNYKTINKLVPILKEINKEYITSFESTSDISSIKMEVKPNIILSFVSIGTTVNRNDRWVDIYYKKNYEVETKKITKIIKNGVYKLSDDNNHLYLDFISKNISIKCNKAINEDSLSMLSDTLNEYLDIYKMYINELIDKVGTYTYDISYDQVNSFYRIRAYDFLENINKNVYSFSTIISENQNTMLMNELISFFYKMMLYSKEKKELLSLQYLYNAYRFLNDCSLKMKNNSSTRKIKLELFELLRYLKYDYKDDKSTFTHDALLICNKTIGNIIYGLKDNEELLISYYRSLLDFIEDIKEELDSISTDNPNEKTQKYYGSIKDIYQNFSSNIFAISAYLLKYYEGKGESFDKILNIINKNLADNITDILLNTIDMSYNNRFYSWDTMEIIDSYDNYEVYSVNTVNYLIHLYCKIIPSKSEKYWKIESTYPLSNYVDEIISELTKCDKEEYIKLFKNVKKDVEEDEKEYLRTTHISEEKINHFISRFNEEYEKNNRIINLFKDTKNYRVVEKEKKGINYVGVKNIVDKTYFLDKTPNNRCIVWTNFEENYSYSFIEAEEKKVSIALQKKSEYKDTSISSYLKSLSISKLRKSIIFSPYDSIYNLFSYDEINHCVEENNYAYMYIIIKGVKIPVCIINNLEDGYIYHTYTNKIGKLEKSQRGFNIEVKEFLDNKELLDEYMKATIKGLSLEGDEKRNHLLESVNILIEEYVIYDDSNLEASKFDH